jgi:hypothetical protein
MSEGKEIYITGDVKSNFQVSMCGDGFGSILGSKLEFNFSNVLVIGGCGVKSSANAVKVDRFSLDKIKPF